MDTDAASGKAANPQQRPFRYSFLPLTAIPASTIKPPSFWGESDSGPLGRSPAGRAAGTNETADIFLMKTTEAIAYRNAAALPPGSQMLDAIDAALGSKDRYTQEHARRVSLYAIRLARRIGLSDQQAHQIGIGGLLHDIGKIGLSKQIFNNTTRRLGKEMREEMQQHPHLGATLLESIGILTPVLDYVYCHHERMDGSGYPRGLKADKIPLGARIISVADCFDAITSDRPYQKRKSCRQALRILRQLSGTSLDPSLVETFVEEVEENGLIQNDRVDSRPTLLHIPAVA